MVRFFVDPRPFAFRRRRQAGGCVPCSLAARRPAWSNLAIRAVPGETRHAQPTRGLVPDWWERKADFGGRQWFMPVLEREICCLGGWFITVDRLVRRCSRCGVRTSVSNGFGKRAQGVMRRRDIGYDIRVCGKAGTLLDQNGCMSYMHAVTDSSEDGPWVNVRIIYSFYFRKILARQNE